MGKERGYTLVGLLTAVALLALLSAGGAPVFADLAHQARFDTATDRLHRAIRFTRHAAVTRGTPVVMAASGADWRRGWLIFVDSNADGEPQAAEPRLRHAGALPPAITAAANTGIGEALHYQPDGGTRRPSGSLQMGTFALCQRDAQGRPIGHRSIIINASGRARIVVHDPPGDDC